MEFDYREGRCFVCGAKNVDGLNLVFKHYKEGRSQTKCTFESRHQGYDNIVHGGILAAVLDDTMAHAIMATGPYAVTAEMKIRYKKPSHVGEELTFEGEMTKPGKRFAEARATIKGPDGTIRVESTGIFSVTFGDARFDIETES